MMSGDNTGVPVGESWVGRILSVLALWILLFFMYIVGYLFFIWANASWELFGVLVGGIAFLAYGIGFPVYVTGRVEDVVRSSLTLMVLIVFGLVHVLICVWFAWLLYEWKRYGVTIGGVMIGVYGVVFPIYVFKAAKVEVPENYAYVIDKFGKFYQVWNPGLHFIFPFFGMSIRPRVKTTEQRLALRMSDAAPEAPGKGSVEIKDDTVSVDCDVYFVVEDVAKSANNVADPIGSLEERVDSLLRSLLSGFTLDEANREKGHMTLIEVMSAEERRTRRDDGTWDPPYPAEIGSVAAWRYILDEWGIRIIRISPPDLGISTATEDQRRRLLEARKDKEVAKEEQAATIIRAEGEKAAMALRGEGYDAQLRSVAGVGADRMPREKAGEFVNKETQWNNSGAGTTVISEGGGSVASMVAQFLAMRDAINQPGQGASI